MRGEAGEARLDGLRVADIGEDTTEDFDLAVLAGGNQDTRLRYQGEQTDGLEGDRLAAGVGARNHDTVLTGRDSDVDGDDFAAAGFQQRMTRGDQIDAVVCDFRLDAAEAIGEDGAGIE